MASSVGRKRDDTASPSIKDLIHGAPGSLVDALVILAFGLSVGLYLGFSNDARATIESDIDLFPYAVHRVRTSQRWGLPIFISTGSN